MTTFARFDFLDFSCEFLLDTLANKNMIWIYLISDKVNTFGNRKNSLVWFNLEANSLEHFVDGISNHPEFRLGLSKNQAVVAISEVMLDPNLVFERVIEVDGQNEIASCL